MTWKIINISNPGSSIQFGSDDTDKINKLLSGIDVDDVTINSDWWFKDGKLYLWNPAGTFYTTLKSGAVTGNRTLTLPAVTGPDTVAALGLAQTFSNKTLDATCNISAATGSSGPFNYSYFIYNDAGTYKARNGATGAIDFTDADDVGAILASIFNSVGETDPLHIIVDAGDFTLRSWDIDSFRHSNFTIKGAGSGLTRFIVDNDVNDVAGDSRVFSFEAAGSAFTSNSLASNATTDSFAVSTNSITDLQVGGHVVVGSNLILPSPNTVAKAGQHNRIVKIVTTGGSPAYRIILEKQTFYDYNTADSAFIRRVDYLENNHIEGITIMSNQDLTSNITFMRFDFNYDLHVKDVQLIDWADFDSGTFHSCLVTNCCVNSDFSDMEFEISPERGNTFGWSDPENVVGYAVSCRSGCETVYYRNLRFKGMIRHCFTTTTNTETAKNGMPINIWIINANAETSTEAAFDTHNEGKNITFMNCSVNSARNSGNTDSAKGTEDTDAFNTRCNYTRFINCTVYNNGGRGFSSDAGLKGIVYDGCVVNGIRLASQDGINCGADDSVIRNCYVDGATNNGINVGGDRVIISNNYVANCTADGIAINTGVNEVITGNILKSNGAYGIDFTAGDCTSNIIVGNQFISNTSGAVADGGQTGNQEENNVGY